MTARTLGDYLAEHGATGAPHAEAVVETIVALARGAVAIREAVTLGALGSAFSGSKNGTSGGGDIPKDLDLHADALLLEAMRTAPVALYASEELEHPILVNRAAPLAVAGVAVIKARLPLLLINSDDSQPTTLTVPSRVPVDVLIT